MKLSSSYQPSLFETDIYALWERMSAFTPSGNGPTYSVVVPPTNANGNLHLGHALAFAVQDIAVRYHRSVGDRVLFLPGSDHAGFETQVVFERELNRGGKSRLLLSRESLYEQIYAFVSRNKINLESQIRRVGASVDWSENTFSLDPAIIEQAYATFNALWQDNLIYRGERLVNYCTFHDTAFADIEVDYQEEQGHMWQIRYPLVTGEGELVVATTRPETLFGDTAVAVHPDDKRYQKFIGKTVKLPFTNREIPIIADSYVDPVFGTGAVKITPAHDFNDFEVGQRHDLPHVTVIGFDGLLNHEVPKKYRGLGIESAREAILADLKQQDLLVDAVDHQHTVGHCYKCATIIQPLLKEQWFIDIKKLAKPAIEAIQRGDVEIIPTSKKEQLVAYLENIKDWNISRQIVWGIPIPAFQNESDPDDWIFDPRVEQEIIVVNNKRYRRDPDVFDTWFSSSSWPYAALGYPNREELKTFFPLSLMETGFDILMPWVSRMLMMSLYVTGQIPFKLVYLHGLITDEQGRKMSKSKGNGVDPMELIKQYGSDAVRIGIINGQTPGNNQPYMASKMVGGRNFTNKIWNIARYIESLVDNFSDRQSYRPITQADHWILQRYHQTFKAYRRYMDGYRFFEAYEALYGFVWNDFADWYIEISKTNANKPLMAALLEATLVLVHPFAPFLSETIWQTLELSSDSLLSGQALIELKHGNPDKAKQFTEITKLITSIRSTIMATAVNDIILYSDEPLIKHYQTEIKRLAKLKAIEPASEGQGILVTGSNLKALLGFSEQQIKTYLDHLASLMDEQQQQIIRLKGRLANSSYLAKAPESLIIETREQLSTAQDLYQKYDEQKNQFED